ncbi:hypothetical protein GCM10027403_06610 [Arthrobacter tecti]
MKIGIKHFIAGGALVILSTFFVPQGISGFATAAARNEPVHPGSGVLLAVGAVMVVLAIALFARGHMLRYRHRRSVQTWETREEVDPTASRPGHFSDRPGWWDRPANHMGDNTGHKRD